MSFFLTDPGDIAAVTQLHTAITREKETLERKARSYNTTVSEVLGGIEIETETWKDVYLEYETLSGSFISRAYTIPVTAELLADPSSPAALLNEILNRPELVEQSYFRNLPENAELVRASVNTYDTAAGGFNDSKNGDENLSALLDAVHSDIAAGRLGRRYLLENEERYQNCYYNDLTLTFYYTYIRDDGTRDSNTVDVCITLQTTAADTLRELRRLGILDEDHVLLTHAEMQQRDQPYMDYSIQEDVPADEALQIYNRHTS